MFQIYSLFLDLNRLGHEHVSNIRLIPGPESPGSGTCFKYINTQLIPEPESPGSGTCFKYTAHSH